MQSLKAQTNKIQENLIGFLRKFLLPFGVTPNCKRGFEKMNGVGNCTVFACEKSFTAGNSDANSAENVSSSHSFQYFGKIDALLLSPQNDWIVIDYKNSRIPAVQDIFADENDILKDFQMSVYFKLIKEQKISDYKVGDIVTITSVIGTVGGGESYDNCSTGAHLHFGILKGWSGYTYYNPRNYIKFPGLGSRFTTRFY